MLYRNIVKYKYQLENKFFFRLSEGARPNGKATPHRFIFIDNEGWVTVKPGYAWNGASGPTIDSKSTMVPCLIHDICYDLMSCGILPPSARKVVDQRMRRDLRAWGMNAFRAWYWYHGVRIGGGSHIKKADTNQWEVHEVS